MGHKGRNALWKLARRVRNRLQLEVHRFRWHAANRHNETSAVNHFDSAKVHVGNFTYGPLRVIDGAGASTLEIGSFCSIAEDVTFVLNADHPLDRLTTFPLRAFVLGEEEPVMSRGDIVLGDDVWIGHGALVLSGVRLGRGSVVAAGSVVTRDVADYAIVAGVPARFIRTRLESELVDGARGFDLERLDNAFVRAKRDALESPLSPEVLRSLGSREE